MPTTGKLTEEDNKENTTKTLSQWWILWLQSSLKEPTMVLWEVPVAAHELGQEKQPEVGCGGEISLSATAVIQDAQLYHQTVQ